VVAEIEGGGGSAAYRLATLSDLESAAAVSSVRPGPITGRGPFQERIKRRPALGCLINEYDRAA
jgi:hypothetical protein